MPDPRHTEACTQKLPAVISVVSIPVRGAYDRMFETECGLGASNGEVDRYGSKLVILKCRYSEVKSRMVEW